MSNQQAAMSDKNLSLEKLSFELYLSAVEFRNLGTETITDLEALFRAIFQQTDKHPHINALAHLGWMHASRSLDVIARENSEMGELEKEVERLRPRAFVRPST